MRYNYNCHYIKYILYVQKNHTSIWPIHAYVRYGSDIKALYSYATQSGLTK